MLLNSFETDEDIVSLLELNRLFLISFILLWFTF